MKRKNTIIFPIILALLLPILRATYGEVHYSVYQTAYTSFMVITLWYLLWQLWDIKQRSRKWNALGLFGILLMLAALHFYIFGTRVEFELIGLLFPIALFLTVQYALRSQQKASDLFLEKEQLKTENYKAQLKTLRTQVDPHFLFNSLNTLRSMVRQTHDQSEQFILSLSDFYRQTLKYSKEVKLALSKELKVLESYLFISTKTAPSFLFFIKNKY
ncbi:MAG: histidine kinase, partial [Bacteroidota bacterium]